MGKSAVLKDMKGRPAGYMRRERDGVVCCAQIAAPAQMEVVCADGSSYVHEISGSAEQRYVCGPGEVVGCYVFRGEELLMISDESMRGIFEKQRSLQRNGEQEKSRQDSRQKITSSEEGGFPQRRWPPPPCMEGAVYRAGRWREE